MQKLVRTTIKDQSRENRGGDFSMPETYERDGVVYFREPYKASMTEWVCSYLDCDALVDHIDYDSDTMLVYAYSKDFEKIKEVRGTYQILGSLSSQEVNSID